MRGAVDCDVHVEVPDNAELLPYLSPYWREAIESRAIHRAKLALVAAPLTTPLACREDWRPPGCPPDPTSTPCSAACSTASAPASPS
ncbi:MAG: hypothetical protein N2Z67_09680 [Acetobacteraceae bacterium]|nr:hypothetical protein [Acetobacteraceae bacterium]